MCVCVSTLVHTGVVLRADSWKLPRRCDHRPPQPVTVPRHWHCLQLPGLLQALRLQGQLPHESQTEVRALVKTVHAGLPVPAWSGLAAAEWPVRGMNSPSEMGKAETEMIDWWMNQSQPRCLLSSYFSGCLIQTAKTRGGIPPASAPLC